MNHPVITGLILGAALGHLVFMAIFAAGVLYVAGAFE